MMNVTITVNENDVKAALKHASNKSGIIIARAANRATSTAKKTLASETSKIYEVRQKDVTESLKIVRKASASKPYATLVFKSSHKNLYYWSKKGRSIVSPSYPVKNTSAYDPDPKFVRAHVMKAHAGGIALSRDPKPFVQITQSGKIALFERTSSDPRAALQGVAGPDVTQILKNKDVVAKFRRDTGAMLLKRLEHEIKRELS